MIKQLIQKLRNLCEKIKTSDVQWELMKKCERAINEGVAINCNVKSRDVVQNGTTLYSVPESEEYTFSVNPNKIFEAMGIKFQVPVKFKIENGTEEPLCEKQ